MLHIILHGITKKKLFIALNNLLIQFQGKNPSQSRRKDRFRISNQWQKLQSPSPPLQKKNRNHILCFMILSQNGKGSGFMN